MGIIVTVANGDLKMNAEERNIKLIGGTFDDPMIKQDSHAYNVYAESAYKKTITDLLTPENCTRILDVGCGRGLFGPLLRTLGAKQLVGVDISSERLQQATNKGYDYLECCNFVDYKTDGYFDVVLASDVWLHVLEDAQRQKFLRNIYSRLNPNGVFVFSFANALYASKSTHCRFDWITEVKQSLKQNGFEVDELQGLVYGFRSKPKWLPITDALFSKTFPRLGRVVWIKARKIGGRI